MPTLGRLARLLVVLAAAALILPPASSVAGQDGKERTQILCGNGDGSAYRPKEKPRQCVVFGPGGGFAGGINLKKIHWASWGGKKAKGTMIECGFHLPCEDIEGKVRASKPEEHCGRVVYTKIKATTRYGKATPPLPVCPGPTF